MNDKKNLYLEWDVVNWSPVLDYWQSKVNRNFRDLSILEIGGRHGGISLWMAEQGANVICSDLDGPSETAKSLHSKFNLSDQIRYEEIDATCIDYESEFDIIVFKSVLGGVGRNENIEAQQLAIDSILKALKPGGQLVYAENLVASKFHQVLRERFVPWGQFWRYITIDEMKVFLKDFKDHDYYTTGFLGTFGRNETQRRVLGSLDQKIFNGVVPDKWKYIMAGVATKEM